MNIPDLHKLTLIATEIFSKNIPAIKQKAETNLKGSK